MGKNSYMHLLYDNWLGISLAERIPDISPNMSIDSIVSDYLHENGWPLEIKLVVLINAFWMHSVQGSVSTSESYGSLRLVGGNNDWAKKI